MYATILAILAGLCWGVGEVCTKFVLHSKQVGPITAVTVRCVVALPVVVLVYLIAVHWLKVKQEPAQWYRAEPRVLWTLVLGSGLCAGAAAVLFFYAALNLGDISRIKPIAFTLAPATAVLLGKFVLSEDVSLRKWIAVALILTGVLLLSSASTSATAPSDASSQQPGV